MVFMLGEVMRIYENVVQINKNKSVEKITHNIIDQSLKNCRGVRESERHYQIFVMT